MRQIQIAGRIGSSLPRERIVRTAIRLYGEMGYRKTTVADVARGASMSAANLYRFFPSRQALEDAAVTELLEQEYAAAAAAARSGCSGLERLNATFKAISGAQQDRLVKNIRLHELVVAAGQANWPACLSHADRLRGVVRSIIAAGQASGEFRAGSPMALACCLLDAMDAYLNPSRIKPGTVQPAFDEMMGFCAAALGNASAHAVRAQPNGSRADLRYQFGSRA
jgi:AcrR family transcriptional regulator